MGKITGWKLTRRAKMAKREGERYYEWMSKKENVITIEHPPSGWRVYISLEGGETSYSFDTKEKAQAFAVRWMRAHPRG